MSRDSLLRDMQEERRRWAEFEHRDGFHAGFICGALAMGAATFVVFVVVSLTLGAD